MASLIVDVTPILEEIGGEVVLDAEIESGDVVVGDETFRAAGLVQVHASVTNTGAGFVATGSVEMPAIAQCARCLRDFDMTLWGVLEGFYVHRGREHDLPDDQEYGFLENGTVDIGPAVDAALALEAPFAPVHSPDCKGLCPECGIDLNEGACDCPDDGAARGPFGPLKGLLGEEPEADADAE